MARRAMGHMGEDVLGTTSESSGREGTLSVDALRCMEGLGWVLLQRARLKAAGIDTARCLEWRELCQA